ncbi:Uncharacterized protein DBV15_07155 [Temnothorax longispinosus]|uniref:Uncharacterized protein n=1 Tax=Temnothorax longispinosus TaxID=300112 RepID=A0A4S2KK60_9HYME|nr:Uncharacterized protein DBV15_07155 [Temnothorax longispinosus]
MLSGGWTSTLHKERLLDYSTKVSSAIFPRTPLHFGPLSPPGLFNPFPTSALCIRPHHRTDPEALYHGRSTVEEIYAVRQDDIIEIVPTQLETAYLDPFFIGNMTPIYPRTA